MADKIIKVPISPVVGVPTAAATAATALLDLPIGPRYHVLWLRVCGVKTSAAVALSEMVTNIRVKVNGKSQRTITAAQLDTRNRLMGDAYRALWGSAATAAAAKTAAIGTTTPTNGHYVAYRIPILFAEDWRKSYAAAEVAAWPTVWKDAAGNRVAELKTLQVELDIPGTSSVTVESIVAYAEVDNVSGMVVNGAPVFQIAKWQTVSVPYSGTGDLTITTLPKRDRLQQLNFFMPGTDALTNVKLTVDGRIIRDIGKQENDAALLAHQCNSSAISAYNLHVVFDQSDFPGDALNLDGVKDFQVTPTVGTAASANNITLVTEYFGPPD